MKIHAVHIHAFCSTLLCAAATATYMAHSVSPEAEALGYLVTAILATVVGDIERIARHPALVKRAFERGEKR